MWSGFTGPRLLSILLLLCTLFLTRDFWLPTNASTPPPGLQRSQDDDCRTAHGADKVMVVLKTGATEAYEKLPMHVLGILSCTPHYLIFSDMAQTIAGHQVLDGIVNVSERWRSTSDDFRLYHQIQEYQVDGQNVGTLKGDRGWGLDKWKFLPMLHETYEKSPQEVDWFVFIEADTSLSWTNLLQWLKTMNPKIQYYLGSQNSIGGTTFAHGGSGFVVSRAAIAQLETLRNRLGKEAYDERWENITAESCCGDEVIARALLEAGVPLTPAWPLMQGERVSTIDFTTMHWCSPPITWHHVTPNEVDAMWQYQKQWVDRHGWDTPYLYSHIFTDFIEPHLFLNRTSWDNLSQDKKFIKPEVAEEDEGSEVRFEDLEEYERQSVESFDNCAEACRKSSNCLQFMYMHGRCYLGNVVRLGGSDDRESERWASGWLGDRVQAFKDSSASCEVNWHG